MIEAANMRIMLNSTQKALSEQSSALIEERMRKRPWVLFGDKKKKEKDYTSDATDY